MTLYDFALNITANLLSAAAVPLLAYAFPSIARKILVTLREKIGHE